MPINYSKWDALELSDDSDIEVHPNVDKKSFIRAKQHQIHQQRLERRHQIETLKYERIVNDGMLRRIDTLLTELKQRKSEIRDKDKNAFLYQALISSAGDPDEDEPPKPPAGVHTQGEPMRYSQMMGALIDQVKQEVDKSESEDWYHGYTKGVEGHKKKVAGLQKDLITKLAELEKEESRKITSENIHDGFNSSSISKGIDPPTASKGKKPTETVEVLNPAALSKGVLARADSAQSSGADADIDEDKGPLERNAEEEVDDEHIEASEAGTQFSQINMGDYRASLQFISQHKDILTEKETDGLLVAGFDAQLKGNAKYAKQCVHQALLLQYCRSLGRDGVGLFFKRITTPGHSAQKVFMDDVEQTYGRIKARTAEINAERAANPQTDQVEQIQLQAVEPGTEIHINVPRARSEDPVEQQARAVFETFPPGLQRALEIGSLDRVNEVLGKMSVEEAEEIVGHLGEHGMLDMREGVIDGTTEEGKEELKHMKDQHEKEKAEITEARPAAEIQVADPD